MCHNQNQGEHMNRKIPFVTRDQMKAIDRLMAVQYHIGLIQMMENAGLRLAELTRKIMGGSVEGRSILAVCGSGNNGGGGMVAARHLHNWGARMTIKINKSSSDMKIVPKRQLSILRALNLRFIENINDQNYEVILDAVMGYGADGNPRGEAGQWIQIMNESKKLILSLDSPSGLDVTTGKPGKPCVKAYATLTLALPKTGFQSDGAKPFIGQLYLADIGIPRELINQLGIVGENIFVEKPIIKIES